MSDLKLCFGCMEPLGSEERVCARCGYDRNTTSLANYLKPGTLLHERFLVGKMLAANGEGVTYIGYDTSVDCKILIREYFPERLCSRVPNSTKINVNYEHLAQYKALMAEYTELNKALARLRNLSHLNPALDMFAENNTTYAVYEYLEGSTLLDYLKDNAGELSWNTVRRIFPPLFTTLSLLHNAGVLHRGLSPETIFVTDKGEIKLTGFCISAVRTNDTELDAELFDGYAAPEQYFADRQQGTWTDVYGICAVLYRILTGCRATDAMSRQDYDSLVPPSELNTKIPENVSDGIMKGLLLDGSARVRTITDLVTLLFNTEAIPEQEPQNDVDLVDPLPASKASTAVFHPQTHHTAEQSGLSNHSAPSPQRRPQPNGQRPRSGSNPNRNGQGSGQHRNGQSRNPQNRSGQHPQQRRPAGANGQHRPPQRTADAVARAKQSANRSGNGYPQGHHRRPAAAAAGASAAARSRKEEEFTIFDRIRAPLLIAILFFAIATLVVWAIIKVLSGLGDGNNALFKDKNSSVSDNVIPAETGEAEPGEHLDFVVPDLIGKNYQLKKDEMDQYHYLVLEPEFVFREDHVKDMIYEQEIEPGTLVATGSTLKVKVSLGTSKLLIPDFEGLKLNSYLKKLEDMGLVAAVDGGGNNNIAPGMQSQYYWGYQAKQKQTTAVQTTSPETTSTTTKDGKTHVVKYISKVDYNYQNGYVCAVEPAPGTPFDALDDYEITVYYAYNPVYINVTNGSQTGTTASGTKNPKQTGTTVSTKTTAKLPGETNETKQQEQQQTKQEVVSTDPPPQITEPPTPPPEVTNPPATNPPPPEVTNPPATNPPADPPPEDAG